MHFSFTNRIKISQIIKKIKQHQKLIGFIKLFHYEEKCSILAIPTSIPSSYLPSDLKAPSFNSAFINVSGHLFLICAEKLWSSALKDS